MAGAELGNELGGVFGGVYGEGFGDGEEGGGKLANGELFTGSLNHKNQIRLIRELSLGA